VRRQDDDHALVQRMARGDRTALAETFDRYAASVTRVAWALAPTPDAARALVQESFLALWSRAADVRLVTPSLLPWLLATCSEHARAGAADGAPGDPLRFARADVGGMSATEHALCERCVVDGRSYVQAAQDLGLSPSVPGKAARSGRASRKAVTRDGL